MVTLIAITMIIILKIKMWQPSVQVLPSVSGQNAIRVPQNDFSRSLSILGGVSCLCIMFMSSVFFALIAMGIAILVYKYIELKG